MKEMPYDKYLCRGLFMWKDTFLFSYPISHFAIHDSLYKSVTFIRKFRVNICMQYLSLSFKLPFFPRAGIDDINFDILVFLQWGEKNVKTKFLEATLCVMLFKMKDKTAIIQLEIRTKILHPKRWWFWVVQKLHLWTSVI